MRPYLPVIALVICVASSGLVTGCASDATNEEEAETAQSDEALTSASLDQRGSVRVGETVTLAYRTSTKYATYAFTGTKGDLVDLKVRSEMGGNAMMYVLDSRFATVASNNTSVSKDLRYLGFAPHVQVSLPQTGTYYVAFRFPDSANVTLTTGFMPKGAPSSDDPFDPGSCPGASLTFKDAAKLVATQTANPTRAPFKLMVRRRGCSDTRCDAWGAPVLAEPVPRYGQSAARANQPIDGFIRFALNSGGLDRGSRGDTIRIYASMRQGGGGAVFHSFEPRALPQSMPLTFIKGSPSDSILRYNFTNVYWDTHQSYVEPPFTDVTATASCVRMTSSVHYNNSEQYGLIARF